MILTFGLMLFCFIIGLVAGYSICYHYATRDILKLLDENHELKQALNLPPPVSVFRPYPDDYCSPNELGAPCQYMEDLFS